MIEITINDKKRRETISLIIDPEKPNAPWTCIGESEVGGKFTVCLSGEQVDKLTAIVLDILYKTNILSL